MPMREKATTQHDRTAGLIPPLARRAVPRPPRLKVLEPPRPARLDVSRVRVADAAPPRQTPLADQIRSAHAEPGTALDPGVRAPLEARFGRDLSEVRIHETPQAGRAAGMLGARAFTVGADIFLGEEGRRTSGAQRQRLLAHEAVHAAQQSGRRAVLAGAMRVSSPADLAEVQAREAAEALTGGSRALALRDALRTQAPSIQRDIREADHDIGSGKFSIDFTSRSGRGTAGEDGTISFMPSAKSPESNAIRFIQIVRVTDAAGALQTFASVDKSLATMDTMATKQDTKKNVAGGFAVDQTAFPAPRTAKADPAVEPFYDVTGPPIPGNATGVHKGKTLTAAVLEDRPSLPAGRKVSFVSSVKGADNGIFYGTALWGFETFADKGLVKVKNEYHSFRAVQGETTDAALKAFDEHYKNPGSAGAPTK
jgi:hypothetical protein